MLKEEHTCVEKTQSGVEDHHALPRERENTKVQKILSPRATFEPPGDVLARNGDRGAGREQALLPAVSISLHAGEEENKGVGKIL